MRRQEDEVVVKAAGLKMADTGESETQAEDGKEDTNG